MNRAPRFESSIGFLLSQLGVRATRSWTAVLAERNLSPHQHAVLLALYQFGPLGLTELATLALVDPRNMGPVLGPLEAHSLIDRNPHPTDRRRTSIELTSAGRKVAAELAIATKTIENELLAPLDARQRKDLQNHLLLLWQNPPSG